MESMVFLASGFAKGDNGCLLASTSAYMETATCNSYAMRELARGLEVTNADGRSEEQCCPRHFNRAHLRQK
jgi:hypothetical protein